MSVILGQCDRQAGREIRQGARGWPAVAVPREDWPARTLVMTLSRFLAAAAVSTLLAAQALAQTAPPATPQRPQTTPAQTAPVRPATTPATPPAATTQQRPAAPAAGQAQTARVNLNTANATELDTLPQIGAARAQAIITERAKGRFRDWADFERRMAGTSVNQTALNAIKDRVRF